MTFLAVSKLQVAADIFHESERHAFRGVRSIRVSVMKDSFIFVWCGEGAHGVHWSLKS